MFVVLFEKQFFTCVHLKFNAQSCIADCIRKHIVGQGELLILHMYLTLLLCDIFLNAHFTPLQCRCRLDLWIHGSNGD